MVRVRETNKALQGEVQEDPRTYMLYELETGVLEREAEAEDGVVRAHCSDGPVGLEYAARLAYPSHVEAMIRFETHGPVPRALVHGNSASVLDRHATVREAVGRVGEVMFTLAGGMIFMSCTQSAR